MDQGAVLLTVVHVRRFGRVAMYAGLTLTGIVSMFAPSHIVSTVVPPWVTVSWAGSMAVTGAICFYGTVSGRWIGEYSGLPLLGVTLLFYSFAVLLSADSENFARIAYGLLILSFSSGLFARWRDVQKIRSVSMERATGERRG